MVPGPFWIDQLAVVFEVLPDRLREAASLTRVNRREFLNWAALAAAHGGLATKIVAPNRPP